LIALTELLKLQKRGQSKKKKKEELQGVGKCGSDG
jgi:hypothetical protein